MLLHGLGRTRLSMRALQRDLENSGFCVWNKSYPSTKKSIEELSCVVGQAIAECTEKNATSIHFVTHSLGGILVRHYFQHHSIPNIGKVVMLGPPNHGSDIVDHCRDKWWLIAASPQHRRSVDQSGRAVHRRECEIDPARERNAAQVSPPDHRAYGPARH